MPKGGFLAVKKEVKMVWVVFLKAKRTVVGVGGACGDNDTVPRL